MIDELDISRRETKEEQGINFSCAKVYLIILGVPDLHLNGIRALQLVKPYRTRTYVLNKDKYTKKWVFKETNYNQTQN